MLSWVLLHGGNAEQWVPAVRDTDVPGGGGRGRQQAPWPPAKPWNSWQVSPNDVSLGTGE